MEDIILYTTGCPKCKVLESKLKQNNIQYQEINDINIMTEKGFMFAPILTVNGTNMDFSQANNWINERE